jgi:hypothetical protein
MAQQNSLSSLQTLLRLKTPQNATTTDPWLARRSGEIASGLDDFVPDADSPDYKYDQIEKGARYGVSLPRADARSADMSRLRQVLGFKQMDNEAEIAKSVLGSQAAMDRVLAAQNAQTSRTQMQQEGSNARSEADRAAREATLETRLSSMETQQAARDAAAAQRTQMNIDGRAAAAQAKKPRTLMDILRALLPGGGEEEAAAAPVAAAPEATAVDPREERRRRYGY